MNAKFTPLHSHTYHGREVIEGVPCDIFSTPAESFEGLPVESYLAIPCCAEMRVDCAIHSKDVPSARSSAEIPWERFPEWVEC